MGPYGNQFLVGQRRAVSRPCGHNTNKLGPQTDAAGEAGNENTAFRPPEQWRELGVLLPDLSLVRMGRHWVKSSNFVCRKQTGSYRTFFSYQWGPGMKANIAHMNITHQSFKKRTAESRLHISISKLVLVHKLLYSKQVVSNSFKSEAHEHHFGA
jgi:hypothetical protein